MGTSHLRSENPTCQDAHCCQYYDEADLLVCVVSDGAGSASRSEQGAHLACNLVCDLVYQAAADSVHTREFAVESLEVLRREMLKEAVHENLRLREFAATLLVAIVGVNRSSFWQIGDGAICFRLQSQDEFHYAFWPYKGEYANITTFITDDHALTELEFDTVEGALADIAVFSDGLERLALDFALGEPHTKFFSGFFQHLYCESAGHLASVERNLEAFLNSDRVNSKTDDDKTLVLATTESR